MVAPLPVFWVAVLGPCQGCTPFTPRSGFLNGIFKNLFEKDPLASFLFIP
jgi:hypothetical protein